MDAFRILLDTSKRRNVSKQMKECVISIGKENLHELQQVLCSPSLNWCTPRCVWRGTLQSIVNALVEIAAFDEQSQRIAAEIIGYHLLQMCSNSDDCLVLKTSGKGPVPGACRRKAVVLRNGLAKIVQNGQMVCTIDKSLIKAYHGSQFMCTVSIVTELCAWLRETKHRSFDVDGIIVALICTYEPFRSNASIDHVDVMMNIIFETYQIDHFKNVQALQTHGLASIGECGNSQIIAALVAATTPFIYKPSVLDMLPLETSLLETKISVQSSDLLSILLEQYPRAVFAMGYSAHCKRIALNACFNWVSTWVQQLKLPSNIECFMITYIYVHRTADDIELNLKTHCEALLNENSTLPSALRMAFHKHCLDRTYCQVIEMFSQVELIDCGAWHLVPFSQLAAYPTLQANVGEYFYKARVDEFELKMKDIKLDNAKKLAAKLKATSGTFLANNDDILRRMLSFFSMKRLCRLETISKRFRSVINDPIVWKSLCTTRFKIKCNHDALYVHDWKKLCIARQHRRRKSIWICPYCDCTFTASSSNSLQKHMHVHRKPSRKRSYQQAKSYS